jgi:hypothetical protein
MILYAKHDAGQLGSKLYSPLIFSPEILTATSVRRMINVEAINVF